MKQINSKRLPTVFVELLLAGMFILFAYIHLLNFFKYYRVSILLIVIMEMLFAFFFITRREAEKTSFSLYAWLTTIGGAFSPLLFRPIEVLKDFFIADIIQIIGFSLAVYGIFSLNQSFGLLPAQRGIKTDGPYRWVRHPLYTAYFLMNSGYLINNFTVYNAVIFLCCMGFQILRLLNEERFLFQYPEYLAYTNKTRWRLLPYIF